MGRKLNGCRSGSKCALRRAGHGWVGRVREVPVPGALAAPQDAPQFQRRITSQDLPSNQR